MSELTATTIRGMNAENQAQFVTFEATTLVLNSFLDNSLFHVLQLPMSK